MTEDRGRWYRVYPRSIEEHPKFRSLIGVELGAWTALRSAAELRDRAMIQDRAEAVLILRRRKIPRPAAMLDRLIALALFDADDAGRISVHDRADHDRQKFPSDDPEKVRDRVRRHRVTTGNESGNDDVTTRYINGNDTHVRAPESGAEAEEVSVSEGGPGGDWDESVRDGADAYYSVTGRFPSDRVLTWINRLTKLYSDDLFSRLLSKCYLEDANPRDLLGRVEERCKAIYYRQHKDEISVESRKIELAALDSIQRQESEAWTKCADCGELGRKHPASGGHPFRVPSGASA